jgi:hypothetical protein
MDKQLFKEKQTFQGKDIIVLASAIVLILVITFYQQVFVEQNFSLGSGAALLLLIAGLAVWIWSLFQRELEVKISNKKIICKQNYWFSRKYKIKLDEIDSCTIVKTPFAAQLHGSNITVGGEKMLSFTGRNGLAIKTNDGQRYFIGSRRVGEMKKAIKKALAE